MGPTATRPGDASGQYKWQRVAVRVFDHAASWDVYEAMQGIRHGPEKAFTEDQIPQFAADLEPLTQSPRAGTRLWVTRELGILRELSSLSWLLQVLADPNPDVADEAQSSIDMLAQVHEQAPPYETAGNRHWGTKRSRPSS